jgi:hypothetical protein
MSLLSPIEVMNGEGGYYLTVFMSVVEFLKQQISEKIPSENSTENSARMMTSSPHDIQIIYSKSHSTLLLRKMTSSPRQTFMSSSVSSQEMSLPGSVSEISPNFLVGEEGAPFFMDPENNNNKRGSSGNQMASSTTENSVEKFIELSTKPVRSSCHLNYL